jgi:signal transduction histidine kinase
MERASDSINIIGMLRELAEALADARTEDEVCRLTIAIAQQKLAGLPFALLYLLNEDGRQARLCGVTGLVAGSAVAPLQVDLQGNSERWLLAQVIQTGKMGLISDLECINRLMDCNGDQRPKAEIVLVVPVARAGQQRVYGALVIGISSRWLDLDYQDFCFLVADRIACALATIENARLYQQSQEAIQMRDELLATVSHDLKNPLGAIKGYTQLLQRFIKRSSIPEREQLSTSLNRIDATTVRMTALLNELMDLARAHLEQSIELTYSSLDYVALLHQAITEQQQTTQKQIIRLETTLTTLPGRGDITRLDRVFSNLLSNAIKYDPGEMPVLVTLDREEHDGCSVAMIEVRDQGIGIPTADLPHIFEQFHRASNVGTVKGTGVGLSSAKQIIELHGGTIAVQSTEGQGSTFTVHIPLYPQEA